MTPAKRRPATPASQGPTRTAPDAAQEAATRDDGGDTAPQKEAGQVDPVHGATKQSPRRPSGLPLPVWPD